MFKPPSSLTVWCDKREKTYRAKFPLTIRLLSPSGSPFLATLRAVPQTLGTGDYCLAGEAHEGVIEKKSSLLELKNYLFGAGKSKFLGPQGQLDRLEQESRFPWVLLDIPPGSIYDTSRMDYPEHVVNAIGTLMLERPRIRWVWCWGGAGDSGRYVAGQFIVRLLWSSHLAFLKGEPCPVSKIESSLKTVLSTLPATIKGLLANSARPFLWQDSR